MKYGVIITGGPARHWADAGATWRIESNWEIFDPVEAGRRIGAGPPR